MAKKFVAMGVKAGQAKAAEPRRLSAREEAQAKAALEKTTARGGNKRLGHKVYPHLD